MIFPHLQSKMKKVTFNDFTEICYVPKTDNSRYPDRELIEKKRLFNSTVEVMKNLLRPIHLMKNKFIKGKHEINREEYLTCLKSLNKFKLQEQEIYETEFEETITSSDDDLDYEYSEESISDEQCSDCESLEIVFE